MKKIVPVFAFVLVIISCGGSSANKDPATTKTRDANYEAGLALVAKYKCATCHAIDETFTGPPYREVSKRYADRPDTIVQHLAGKIIRGGSGVWGELFMTPNPDVSQQDAETMVRYVLQLSK